MTRAFCHLLLFFHLPAAVVLGLLAAPIAHAAAAHPAVSTIVKLTVSPTRQLRIDVICDPIAFTLAARSAEIPDDDIHALLAKSDQDLASALAQAAGRMNAELQVLCDHQRLSLALVDQPAVSGLRVWAAEHPTFSEPCVMAYSLVTTLPAGARAVEVGGPPVLGDILLVIERPGLERSILPFDAGELSYGIDISMVSPPAPPGENGMTPVPPAAPPADQPGMLATAWRYVALGFKHIVPNGVDHALLILGLFLLTPRLRPLLWQVTAFTVAHCITLTLAVLGLATIRESLVEPVIALSVALIGIENLLTRESKPWRVAVVFVFGLVHGLGFASGLAEIGLPAGQLATGIVGFSVGVELGHIAVLAAAFAALAWARERPWFRSYLALPGSALIAAIGLFWAAARIIAG